MVKVVPTENAEYTCPWGKCTPFGGAIQVYSGDCAWCGAGHGKCQMIPVYFWDQGVLIHTVNAEPS